MFTDAIQAAGGDAATYVEATVVETETLFDATVAELYNTTGGTMGDRSTLPPVVQGAYAANELRASFEIAGAQDAYPKGGEHDAIVEQVRATSQETRKWLPW